MMNLFVYLTIFFLTKIIYSPIKVFLVLTGITTIFAFFFLIIGEKIYSKFKKKDNFNLFIATAITLLIYLILKGFYNMATGLEFGLNLAYWLIETVYIFVIIKIVSKSTRKLKEYNLPKGIEYTIFSLLGSTIAWAGVIILFYFNYLIL